MSDSPFLDETFPEIAPPEARYVWAVVTLASPLRIRLDGDRVALGITPDDMGGVLRSVGSRVYCQILNRRLVVMGPNPTNSLMPPGAVIATAQQFGVPNGWLNCMGQAVPRNTYANLFAAVGTRYGIGDNSTTFNVPNMQGRVIVSYGEGDPDYSSPGNVGGARTHTNTIAEMASHFHSVGHNSPGAASINNDGVIYQTGPGSGIFGFNPDTANTGTFYPFMTNAVGSATPFDIRQPYMVMQYIIKT